MKINSIDCNQSFTARNLQLRKINKKRVKATIKNSTSPADDILLHFTGMLDALGFKKPLKKLICILNK